MKKYYRNSLLIVTLFAVMLSLFAVCSLAATEDYSSEPFNSAGAPELKEGVGARCTLSPGNNYTAVYQVKPEKDGEYIFFSAGEKKQIRGRLYEGAGDFDPTDYSYMEKDDNKEGVFSFVETLEGGTTYTLLISGYMDDTDTTFDVGFIGKESGAAMASASSITLTDANRDNAYRLAVCRGKETDSDWAFSDISVVRSSGGYSCSGDYYIVAVDLKPYKSGSSTVKCVDKVTGEVYATCNVTCKDITEYYDVYVGGCRQTAKMHPQ